MKNYFQVIDCSNLADHYGMANLIPAARNCLAEDLNAVILTNSLTWQLLKPTVPEYVETALMCPMTVIPTLYGLRLTDHVQLGC